jgi:hypothetical protein
MLTDDMLIVGGSFEREDGVVCVAGGCMFVVRRCRLRGSSFCVFFLRLRLSPRIDDPFVSEFLQKSRVSCVGVFSGAQPLERQERAQRPHYKIIISCLAQSKSTIHLLQKRPMLQTVVPPDEAQEGNMNINLLAKTIPACLQSTHLQRRRWQRLRDA